MTASRVSFGPPSAPASYTGQVTYLAGSVLQAVVTGTGGRLGLAVSLTSQTATSVAGVMAVTQVDE